MADGIVVEAVVASGETLAADDISSVKYPRGKLIVGINGVNDGDVAATNPMPIGANTAKDGTGTVYAPLVDGDGHLQVDVIAAIPAGTNSIGKLTVNAGVNIGEVSVDGVVPGSGATQLGKAIDSVGGADDIGVAVLAIRDDSLSSLTPAQGDWVPFRVNSTGALHVTGAGGGTQYAIDTAAGGVDTGTLALAIRDDTLTPLTPADGDYTGLRVDSTGQLYVTGGGGGTQYAVNAALGATPTGTLSLAVRDDALSTLTPVEGDAVELRVGSKGALWTEISGGVVVTNAGTFTVQATQSGAWSVAISSDQPIDRATDNIGVALQTDVIANDTTMLTPKFAKIDYGLSGNNTIVAAVAGKKIRVLSLMLVTGAAVNVRFEDGASGTALTGQMVVSANGGFTLPFSPVGWMETSAATLLNMELSSGVTVDGLLVYVEV